MSDNGTQSLPTNLPPAYNLTPTQALHNWHSDINGLSNAEVALRQAQYGPNRLPQPTPAGISRIFLRQFLSPLIYILLIAAAVSLLIGEWTDAGFIFAVLIINAVIGTSQEYSAQRSATALQQLVATQVRVLRAGDAYEIDTTELVPGDVVLLESGLKVPADMRLLKSHALDIDESLLTGESLAVAKQADSQLDYDVALGDRINMAYAGTHVARGRGLAMVTAIASMTELGALASAVFNQPKARPPLLARLHYFVLRIAAAVGLATLLLAFTAAVQGTPWHEVFLLAVALAVSAIPEGLPVAVTVALTIGMQRMAKHHVIVRNLVAVETLGSCTYIASDKTGTLTMNALTAQQLILPDNIRIDISGDSLEPSGHLTINNVTADKNQQQCIDRLCRAAVLCNEGFLGHRDGSWAHHGDAVDIALLVMAHKNNMTSADLLGLHPLIAQIPFESEQRFSASLHRHNSHTLAIAKGAVERIVPMCQTMATVDGLVPINAERIEQHMHSLASQGLRVLAIADSQITLNENEVFSEEHLNNLTLLGLIGMIDPLRPDAQQTIQRCQQAGIKISMITGDHPVTALTSARELNMAEQLSEIISGQQLHDCATTQASDQLTRDYRVFARIEPQQKLELVNTMMRQGHIVAVTGDGANDAPALRAAHVGVAMGKSGTDVARESADIIITDDHLASIVAGIEQGRITYRNIRKVIFLLISTGAAEVVLFLLALFSGLPMPLLAVQLLWLNLVTNGIQDIALAFEPGEGDEMQRLPRPVNEAIFDQLMLKRIALSALTIGLLAFITFKTLLVAGYSIEAARNSTLLLMVLFENIHIFNCRSEHLSAFNHNPLRNPLLLFGTVAAQLIHIGAMYIPALQTTLQLQPVSITHWSQLLGIAVLLLIVMELHKKFQR